MADTFNCVYEFLSLLNIITNMLLYISVRIMTRTDSYESGYMYQERKKSLAN